MRWIKVTAFFLILLLMSLPVCSGAQENQKEGQPVYDVITIQAPITPPIAGIYYKKH